MAPDDRRLVHPAQFRRLRCSARRGRSISGAVPTTSRFTADYDGDGRTDIAIWRPSDGCWYVSRSSDGGTTSLQWGGGSISGAVPVDVPVTGDFDGDGKDRYCRSGVRLTACGTCAQTHDRLLLHASACYGAADTCHTTTCRSRPISMETAKPTSPSGARGRRILVRASQLGRHHAGAAARGAGRRAVMRRLLAAGI